MIRKTALMISLAGAIGSASAFDNVDFTKAAASTVNGVVSIKNYTAQRAVQQQALPFNDPFFEYFFGPQPRQRQQPKAEQREPEMRQSGLGSGVIISPDGYIVTNNHVIDGADRLEVTLNDNRTFDASVIGVDPTTDLALIRIAADSLHCIPVGDSESLRVGEWVLAVGNPFGLTSSVTAGIVSAKARNISTMTGNRSNGIESYIQTDAAVNPGNSGGALVNLDGQLVGINAAIFSQTGNYSGSSFAIPTSIMSKVVADLKEYGQVQRALLGVRYGELTPQLAREHGITAVNSGLYVGQVEDGSAAQEAGLAEGDVIIAIDNHPTRTTGELQEVISGYRPGDSATVTVVRDNSHVVLPVRFRNHRGDTEITRPRTVSELGCTFEPYSGQLPSGKPLTGLQVKNITDGRFKDAGIRDGFIILDINNVTVRSAAEVEQLYKSIIESTDYDHVMFITGIYPGQTRKQFYAVDISE